MTNEEATWSHYAERKHEFLIFKRDSFRFFPLKLLFVTNPVFGIFSLAAVRVVSVLLGGAEATQRQSHAYSWAHLHRYLPFRESHNNFSPSRCQLAKQPSYDDGKERSGWCLPGLFHLVNPAAVGVALVSLSKLSRLCFVFASAVAVVGAQVPLVALSSHWLAFVVCRARNGASFAIMYRWWWWGESELDVF